MYLQYLSSDNEDKYVSATGIAKALDLGEVQVRKDLSSVSSRGKPKVGYLKQDLIEDLTAALGGDQKSSAVIVGAGKLGMALLGFEGFSAFGLDIAAAFDTDSAKIGQTVNGRPILPLDGFADYCKKNSIRIGIITVPAPAAQTVCDILTQSGITAIWNFAPVTLDVPKNVIVREENLALSLAHLKSLSNNNLL